MSTQKKRSAKPELLQFYNCRQPVVQIRTDDEERFQKIEYQGLELAGIKHIYEWDATTTLREVRSDTKNVVQNLRALLVWFERPPVVNYEVGEDKNRLVNISDRSCFAPLRSALFIYDAAYFMQPNSKDSHSNAVITRQIISSISALRKQGKFVFLVSNTTAAKTPPELDVVVPTMDYPLPDINYLCHTIESMAKHSFATEDEVKRGTPTVPDMDRDETEKIAQALLGLNDCQAHRILLMSVVENKRKRLSDKDHRVEFDYECITEEKRKLVGEHQAVRVISPRPKDSGNKEGFSKVGGSHALKQYLMSRKELMGEAARSDSIDLPKGVFIFGPGGVGKDLIVEAAGHEMGLPMLFADMAANKAGIQGASHANFRAMLKFAEQCAPCMLIMSEFEKMMAGAMSQNSAACDGGTGNEIHATWLNWMQSRTKPVYVVAIANNIDNVTQPTLRAGRWDAVWFVDMPEMKDRMEILQVCINTNRGYPLDKIDIERIASLTDGFTGAELNLLVNEALVTKFRTEGMRSDGIFLTTEHIERTIPKIHSTGKTNPTEIAKMRAFAQEGGYNVANKTTEDFNTGRPVIESLTALARGGHPEPKQPKKH